MCLILFAYKYHPKYELIFAANRDEFFERPTQNAGFWDEYPDLLAGKDLKEGGTWMGITKQGKMAAVTNFRDNSLIRENAISRGKLVRDYLLGSESSLTYAENLLNISKKYSGYNLLLYDRENLYYCNNKNNSKVKLGSGIYGLSNGFLDSDWPKVQNGKKIFLETLKNENFFTVDILKLLKNQKVADDDKLPDTGVSIELEKVLSSIFIKTEKYGTRSSTVLLIDNNSNVKFVERVFNGEEKPKSENEYEFTLKE